jgi:hypothetical protein
MKTYYAIVNVEDRRFGTYVPAENVAAAFEEATARYKTRHPRLYVETIAVQEVPEEHVDAALVTGPLRPII